jgi:beta-galactosidase
VALARTDGQTPNVVAVEVRHQLPSSRWYSGSGIYRKARLVVTDTVHIARPGAYMTAPDLTSRIPNTANGFFQIAELEPTGS